MSRASDAAAILESIAPLDSGVPGDELGFIAGSSSQDITGVACVWSPDAMCLQRCVAQGLNMIICHESLWQPEQTSPWYPPIPKDAIHANNIRRALIKKHRLVVYRSHSNWDALPGDGIADQAVAALGIPGLRCITREKFFAVHETPDPVSVEALRRRVADGLGYPDCRVFGDATRHIHRFAFLIGGFGENQHHMPQAARDRGAEALIIGEMSEFIVIAALEMNLPVIESLHSASEIPGIRRQAVLMAERLPGVPVRYIESGARFPGPV